MSKDKFLLHLQIQGIKTREVPFWFMRQAGRYLPEYKQVRASCKNFLDFCYTPKKASEVTLQPIRRFGMNAAIIFSDILVIPDALGAKVEFIEGEGPVLEPTLNAKSLSFSSFQEKLSPVYEAIELTRAALPENTSLFGFAGSPWTVACYMVQGKGSREFEKVKSFCITQEEEFSRIIDVVTEATINHLCSQVQAGADVLQLFDSWAGMATSENYEKFIVLPTKTIVSAVKQKFPHIPILGFPRNSGVHYADYAKRTGVDGVSCDMGLSLSWIKQQIQPSVLVQGNLDPYLLAYDVKKAEAQTRTILDTLSGGKFIFNLGHGILQQTPPENVEAISKIIREYRL